MAIEKEDEVNCEYRSPFSETAQDGHNPVDLN